MTYKVVEKANRLAVHSIHSTRAGAERHLKEVVPGYVAKGYYMDKTLTPASFVVVAG